METKSTQPLVAISFDKVVNKTTYIYDIHEEQSVDTNGDVRIEHVGTEVVFDGFPTEKNIKREVINSEFDSDSQQKIENEAILALLEGRTNDPSVAKFHAFAERRTQLFAKVEADISKL